MKRRAVVVIIAFAVLVAASSFVIIHTHRPLAKILMYHSIIKPGEQDEGVYIDAQLFERQLAFLKKHRYETVFIQDIVHRYLRGNQVPGNWVALTFDDGHRNLYTEAFPLLKKYQCKAVFFVIPSLVGQNLQYLTWEEIKKMRASGLVEIGEHSFQHDILTRLSAGEIRAQLKESKRLFEEHLGVVPQIFSYPFGAQNEIVQDILEENGFKAAVGTVYRLGEFKLKNMYNLRRVYVSEFSRYPLVFRFMLSGYYVPVRGLTLRLLNIAVPRIDRYDA